MVYLRTLGDEKILVAINPMDKDVEIDVKLDGIASAKDLIYSFGGKCSFENNKLYIAAKSSAFILL